MPTLNEKTKPVSRRAVVRRHPWMAQFPNFEVVEKPGGTWRFKKNRIVDDLYDLHIVHGLSLNEITIRQQLGQYTYAELLQFGMLLGLSIQGFADMFPVCTRYRRKRT